MVEIVWATVIILIGSVLANLISTEISDFCETWAHWIKRRAVAWLPASERARYDEEWSAHLHECSGRLWKVLTAFGFCIASQRLARVERSRSVQAKEPPQRTFTRLKPPYEERRITPSEHLALLQRKLARATATIEAQIEATCRELAEANAKFTAQVEVKRREAESAIEAKPEDRKPEPTTIVIGKIIIDGPPRRNQPPLA